MIKKTDKYIFILQFESNKINVFIFITIHTAHPLKIKIYSSNNKYIYA